MAQRIGILQLVLVGIGLFISFAPTRAGATDWYDAKINEASLVLSEIMRIPEKGIPPALLDRAYGVAVIPRMIKAGFIIGGKHGKGILTIRSQDGGWTNPTFILINGNKGIS